MFGNSGPVELAHASTHSATLQGGTAAGNATGMKRDSLPTKKDLESAIGSCGFEAWHSTQISGGKGSASITIVGPSGAMTPEDRALVEKAAVNALNTLRRGSEK